jgi:hypothetical protein
MLKRIIAVISKAVKYVMGDTEAELFYPVDYSQTRYDEMKEEHTQIVLTRDQINYDLEQGYYPEELREAFRKVIEDYDKRIRNGNERLGIVKAKILSCL